MADIRRFQVDMGAEAWESDEDRRRRMRKRGYSRAVDDSDVNFDVNVVYSGVNKMLYPNFI
jgi:hypothetical protein